VTVDASAGLRRRKQTPWSVKFGDALASKLIAVGGIGTIAAIMLVVLVLLATAWPLLLPARIGQWSEAACSTFRHVGLDEHQVVLWGMEGSGTIRVLAADTGQPLAQFPSPSTEQRSVTSSHLTIDRTQLVLGFSDGTFQYAQLAFQKELLNAKDVPSEVRVSKDQPLFAYGDSVYQWFDSTSVRQTKLIEPRWTAPKALGAESVTAIDYSPSNTESLVVAAVGNELVLATITRKKAVIGNKFTESMAVERCPLNSRDATNGVLGLCILNNNSQVVAVWRNGTLDRFSISGGVPKLTESASGLLDGGSITSVAPLLARQTMLCGDSNGRVHGWNVIRIASEQSEEVSSAEGSDAEGYHLVPAHDIQLSSKPIRSITSSQRNHVASASDEDGEVSIVFVTTNDERIAVQSPLGDKTRFTAFDPGDDSLLVCSDSRFAIAPLSMAHPETSWATFFGRVWYEGYSEPQYIWQSSAGTERAEAKLSLIPLIFGTLKATVYAMLVSIPLALMAAIYTSEFLSPGLRARVKPFVELMASLPSVVLGFVAALVIAPLLQQHLMTVLLTMILLPLSFVVAGHLWNLMSLEMIAKLQRLRLLGILCCLPLAVFASTSLAPMVERTLFDGDLVGWLNGAKGNLASGWILLFTPLLTLVAATVSMGPLAAWTRKIAIVRTPKVFAVFSLIKLLATMVAVVISAWLVGVGLGALGLDARDSFIDSYQDRNALLVGIALGFCVIPIIYTISDDALQAVPKQLRSASLGCGATPWQTTMRVVVPSAMSGLFSAIMIGLGRAVGETV
jgi:phosphate transport system permease protein